MQTQEYPAERPTNQILVFDADDEQHPIYQKLLEACIAQSKISFANSFEIFTDSIKNNEFNVIIFSPSIEFEPQLLFEFKLLNYTPALIIVTAKDDAQTIAELYNSGAQRCIIFSDLWEVELATAVRNSLRMQRLESENSRLLEKLSEANHQLIERNKRLDEFTGTVAHDIRGPLGGINMRLEYIRDAYSGELDEKFTKIIDSSLSASQRLIDIVQAMYDYAKLGLRAVEFKEINLSQFLRDIVSDLTVDEKQQIHFGIPDLPNIWGNPGLLRKVFINLIMNSIKYNDKEQIIINIAYLGQISGTQGLCEQFYIEDNGPGIPVTEQTNLFEMFHRGMQAHRQADGLGVGLAVVKKIIELHKGEISLDPTYQRGCRFIFSLPGEASS
jgi:signal transduction histidine kinase